MLLSNAVGLVVPTSDERFVDYWCRVIAGAHPDVQGVSAIPGRGYWKPTNEFEEVWFIFTCCPTSDVGHQILEGIWDSIRIWAQDTHQDAVCIIRNGVMENVHCSRYEQYVV